MANFTSFFPSAGTNSNLTQQEVRTTTSGLTLTQTDNSVLVEGAAQDFAAQIAWGVGVAVIFPQPDGTNVSGTITEIVSDFSDLTVVLDFEGATIVESHGIISSLEEAGAVQFIGGLDAGGDIRIGTGQDSTVTIGNEGDNSFIKLVIPEDRFIGGPQTNNTVLAVGPAGDVVRTSKTSFGIAAGEVATWAEGNDGTTIPTSKLPELVVTTTLVFTSEETYANETAALAIFISEWEAGGGGGDFNITGGTTIPTGTLLLLVTATFTEPLIYAGEEITTGDDADPLDFHDITHSGQTVESLTTMNGLTEMTASVGPVTIGLEPSIFTVAEGTPSQTLNNAGLFNARVRTNGGNQLTFEDAGASVAPFFPNGDAIPTDGATGTLVVTGGDGIESTSGAQIVAPGTYPFTFRDFALPGRTSSVINQDHVTLEFEAGVVLVSSSISFVLPSGTTAVITTTGVDTEVTVDGNVTADAFIGNANTATALSAATLAAADDTHFYNGQGEFSAVPAGVSVSSSYTVPISNLAGTDYSNSPITRVEGEQSPFTNNKNISSIPAIGSTKTFGFTTAGGDSFPDVGFAVGDYIRFSGNGIIIDGEVTSFTENQGGGVSNSLDIRVDGTSGTIDTGIAGGYFAPLTVFVDSAITTVRGSLNTLSFEPGVEGVPGSLEGTGTFVDTGATPSPATTSTILSFNGGLAGNFFTLFGSGGTYEVGDNIEFTDSTRTGIFEYTRLGAAPFTDYQFTYVSGDSPASDYAGTISAREAVAGAGTPAMAPKTTVTDDLTVTGQTNLNISGTTYHFEVVDALPGAQDPNTIYFVTA